MDIICLSPFVVCETRFFVTPLKSQIHKFCKAGKAITYLCRLCSISLTTRLLSHVFSVSQNLCIHRKMAPTNHDLSTSLNVVEGK